MRLKRSVVEWNHNSSNGKIALPKSQRNVPTLPVNRIYVDNTTNPVLDTSPTSIANFNRINYTYSNGNVTNCNASSTSISNTTFGSVHDLENKIKILDDSQVCNQQYRESLVRAANSTTLATNSSLPSEENEVSFNDDQYSPWYEEEPMLEQSDTDDTSESGNFHAPRGIVNPNYPGFQHLAHTLKDYSKTIENFYSENEMTDDDLEAEVTDLIYDSKNEEISHNTFTNNNNNENIKLSVTNFNECTVLNENTCSTTNILDSDTENKYDLENIINYKSQTTENENNFKLKDQVPDILQNIDLNTPAKKVDFLEQPIVADSEIERNFSISKNIIGNFNKEVEDEINYIYNYNINIQDDLIHLRKDIEDAFRKPIENTINHISHVVNHVIKRLVIEQQEAIEIKNIYSLQDPTIQFESGEIDEVTTKPKRNDSAYEIKMKHNRPTFLYIESSVSPTIADASLSDAKDELIINDEDYEKGNVELIKPQLQRYVHLQQKKPEFSSSTIKNVDTDENLNKYTKKSTTSNNHGSKEIKNSSEFGGQSRVVKTDYTGDEKMRLQTHKKIIVTPDRSQVGAAASIQSPRIRDESHNDDECSSALAVNEKEKIVDLKSTGKKSFRSKDKQEKLIESFDVYNIETALPKLDMDAIENHLRMAKEAERRKRNDREEIRRRLAMGSEAEEHGSQDRPGRKPSLHSRLQGGKNLQICFMNETVSDNESQDTERTPSGPASSAYLFNHPYKTRPLSASVLKNEKTSQNVVAKSRPNSLSLKPSKSRSSQSLGHVPLRQSDFHALQATLQTEARIALAQAKEMARIQMEKERRSRSVSPVTDVLRRGLTVAGARLPPDRRRISRQLLTDFNIAQLQVTVNWLHGAVARRSAELVRLLLERDDLHMAQDARLVHVEDLTRYLGVKEQASKSAMRGGMRRLTSLVNK